MPCGGPLPNRFGVPEAKSSQNPPLPLMGIFLCAGAKERQNGDFYEEVDRILGQICQGPISGADPLSNVHHWGAPVFRYYPAQRPSGLCPDAGFYSQAHAQGQMPGSCAVV